MKPGRLCLWLPIALCLAGCASGGPAVSRIWGLLFQNDSAAESATLRNDLRYLRVTSAGHVALMVLGYTDPNAKGNTEVWYSGKGEVLKIQNGRIVQTGGLTTDWSDVRLPTLPKWSTITATPYVYRRERDEMPGYRYGIGEVVALRSIDTPTDSLLSGLSTQQLHWYQEDSQAENNSTSTPVLHPARYAVDIDQGRETVLYAEQCLSPYLCLAWQRWPPATGTSAINTVSQ